MTRLSARSQAVLATHKAHPDWSAGKLADDLGCSRNAVIGVLHRAGVKLSLERATRDGKTWRTVKVTMRGQLVLRRAMPLIVPVGPHDPIGCRFITGTPGEPGWRYCQASPVTGKPYCLDHCRICYRPPDEPQAQQVAA